MKIGHHSSLLTALLAVQPMIVQAAVVSNYSDATNLRFDDNPSFIGDAFDLSGVGRITSASAGLAVEGTWATAIGDNYFLSANHYFPPNGSEIRFTAGNSGASPSFTYQVGGGFRVGTTDIWVGYTLQAMDPSIARYSYTTQDANNLGELGLGNDTLYMNGDLLEGRPGLVGDHVLGTNQAESFYNEGSGQFLTPETVITPFSPPSGFINDMVILFDNLPGDDSAPLIHESKLTGGDSGSPLFSASGSTLTVLGVGSLVYNLSGNFIDTSGPVGSPGDPREDREATFYSYVGSYTDEMNTAIAKVPAPIPEPSTLASLTLAGLLAIRRKR